MVYLYHERQEAALCGQHCLNNLLQGPHFTAGDLADIATALDQQERKLMLEAGMTAEARAFMSEDSSNVDASGNFSIQVLSQALQNVFGLALEDSRRPENRSLMQSPDAQTGFVLNRHSHWYCLRKLNNQWWPSAEETPLRGRRLFTAVPVNRWACSQPEVRVALALFTAAGVNRWSCNSTQMAPERITSSGNFSGLRRGDMGEMWGDVGRCDFSGPRLPSQQLLRRSSNRDTSAASSLC